MDITTPEYWNSRYLNNSTPWDIGYASPPITEYFQSEVDLKSQILIPGAGNAHEAEWLWKQGYKNVWVVDIAAKPLENLKERIPDFPLDQLIHMDFFELSRPFDIIVEQTFFCALPPAMRKDYALKMKELLPSHGRLAGVLFNFPLTTEGPPFGGSQTEYQELFSEHFNILHLEACRNSIKPRMGRELFIELAPLHDK